MADLSIVDSQPLPAGGLSISKSEPLPGQHVQGHPLKGQNFGDWLSQELLQPVVDAATQLGKGIQGLGHPEQRPLTESVKDVVQGGMAITTPFVMGGLNNEPAPPGPPSAGAPSAVGTALKGGAMGALKAIPKAAETSILKYTGVPQLARGAYQGAKEALATRAEALKTPPTEAPAPVAAAGDAQETLADGTTASVNDILKGGGVNPAKATREQLAGARATLDKLKAPAQRQAQRAAPSAAEAPPANPIQSAPPVSAQPAPAAAPTAAPNSPTATPKSPTPAPQPGEPGDIDFQQRYGEYEQPEVAKFLGHSAPPEPKPASTAPTAAAAAKTARYADAIGKWARDRGMSVGQIADQWGNASAETRGSIILEMKRKGYLEAWETIPKTSAPGIVDALKERAATIRPPAGFSMGAMKQ